MDYDGSHPIDMPKPVIRNWTPYNCQIASRRRCHYLLQQLPDSQWVRDFNFRVNLAIPQEIQDIEYQLRKAIGIYQLVGT